MSRITIWVGQKIWMAKNFEPKNMGPNFNLSKAVLVLSCPQMLAPNLFRNFEAGESDICFLPAVRLQDILLNQNGNSCATEVIHILQVEPYFIWGPANPILDGEGGKKSLSQYNTAIWQCYTDNNETW